MDTTNKNELFAALAKAQGQFVPVEPNQVVDFQAKNGQRVRYAYADFRAIFSMSHKILSENGLAICQITEDGKLLTILAHSSGQSIYSSVNISQSNDNKVFGANLSYLRRYQYVSICGIVIGEEDNEQVVDYQSATHSPAKKSQVGRQIEGQPAPSMPPSNNNETYVFPSMASKDFYDKAQDATRNYYKNPFHLIQTLGGQWFNFADTDLYEQKLDYVVSHARNKKEDKAPF